MLMSITINKLKNEIHKMQKMTSLPNPLFKIGDKVKIDQISPYKGARPIYGRCTCLSNYNTEYEIVDVIKTCKDYHGVCRYLNGLVLDLLIQDITAINKNILNFDGHGYKLRKRDFRSDWIFPSTSLFKIINEYDILLGM